MIAHVRTAEDAPQNSASELDDEPDWTYAGRASPAAANTAAAAAPAALAVSTATRALSLLKPANLVTMRAYRPA